MGTEYSMQESKFSIPACKIEKALQAILDDGSGYYETLDKIKKRIDHYRHLPPAIKLSELVKHAWGFKLKLNDSENAVIDISWVWEKCCEDNVLQLLAPYVDDGSYIIMRSEDGSQWRWEFDKGALKHKEAKISYD